MSPVCPDVRPAVRGVAPPSVPSESVDSAVCGLIEGQACEFRVGFVARAVPLAVMIGDVHRIFPADEPADAADLRQLYGSVRPPVGRTPVGRAEHDHEPGRLDRPRRTERRARQRQRPGGVRRPPGGRRRHPRRCGDRGRRGLPADSAPWQRIGVVSSSGRVDTATELFTSGCGFLVVPEDGFPHSAGDRVGTRRPRHRRRCRGIAADSGHHPGSPVRARRGRPSAQRRTARRRMHRRARPDVCSGAGRRRQQPDRRRRR